MVETDQVRPLAPSSDRHGSEEDMIDFHFKKLRRRKCIRCCGCIAAAFLIQAVVIIILVFTVFKVKDPIIRVVGVKVEKVDLINGTTTPRPGSNMTLTAHVAVKNPNFVSFRYSNTTTSLYFKGAIVGEARGPPGQSKARRTQDMNITVDIMTAGIMANPNMQGDGNSGLLKLNSLTKVGGKVKIAFIKKHVAVRMNCTTMINITSLAIESIKCKRKLKL